MSFATDGFLSPAVGRFTSTMRKVPAYENWLRFAEDLNRFVLGVLADREIPVGDNQRLMILVLFVRAHKSFQAALILAEKGLLGDARAVVRRAVEGAIALSALASDASFVDDFMGEHYFNQRKTANLLLNDPAYRAMHSAVQIAQMQQTVRDVDAREAAGEKIRAIIWSNVAAKNCKDLYDTLYRLLSSDGTHTNINAMHREAVYGAASQLTGLKIGPDIDGMVETLQANCLMLLWAADPFTRAFDPNLGARVSQLLQRFQQLPQDEPTDTQVVANFGL